MSWSDLILKRKHKIKGIPTTTNPFPFLLIVNDVMYHDAPDERFDIWCFPLPSQVRDNRLNETQSLVLMAFSCPVEESQIPKSFKVKGCGREDWQQTHVPVTVTRLRSSCFWLCV